MFIFSKYPLPDIEHYDAHFFISLYNAKADSFYAIYNAMAF